MPPDAVAGLSLVDLARALGGEAHAGGRRALVPAPGHSRFDRSISLLLDGQRVVAHSFGDGDWRAVLDALRGQGWIDGDNRLLVGGVSAVSRPARLELTHGARVAAAERLWREAGSILVDSPAARHLERRGVDLSLRDFDALRAHHAAPAWAYRDGGPRYSALLAAVRDQSGALTAVEITYLDGLGRRSALARPSRKVIGVLPPGCAVRLSQAAEIMLVGEGVFTVLSAMRRFRLPGWALLSAGGLARWQAPPGVRRLMIAADRGPAGETAAARLRAAARGVGVDAGIVLPPIGEGDWNDLDQEEVRRKGGLGRPIRRDGP